MKRFDILLLLPLCCACSQDLDFTYHDIDPLTVIEANLSEQGLDVRLTQTSAMSEPMDTAALTDFSAALTDLTADEEFAAEDNPQPVPGHNYRLDVWRNGEHFESECVMQPTALIADVAFQWISMPYDKVAVLSILLQKNDPDTGQAWWVRVWRNGEVYKWLLGDDKYAVDGRIELSAMTARQNPDPDDMENLSDGDTLRISATCVPPHIYTYVSNLSAQTIDGPTTFGGDYCLGYFLASTPADTTIIFHPDSF